MRAYSLDLRQEVVAAYERGQSTTDEIATLFSVGPTFVKRMLRLHREGGDLAPLPHGGGHTPKPSDKHTQMLRAEIKRNNDVTIEELRDLLRKKAGLQVSQPTVSRVLARLNLSRKKQQSPAGEITTSVAGPVAASQALIQGGSSS
jgi:transposase